MFYNALIKFRDEQLENYQGPLEYSASDYHHISRPVTRTKPMARQMSTTRIHHNGRRRSQFSIATDGVCSRNSSYNEPKSSRTIESYDPYRSSRTPVSDPPVEYASVTVYRRPSGVAKCHVPGARHQAVSRVQTDEISSSPPQSEISGRGMSHSKRNSAVSLQSRSSIASSRRGYTSVSARRSASYQRNVSFRHLRKRSGASSSNRPQASHTQSQHSIGPDYSDRPTPRPNKSHLLSPTRYSSPSLPTPPAAIRPRNVSGRAANQLKPKKTRMPSNYWKEDARKVSSELGQICEEAFNRSSVSPERPSAARRPEVTATKSSPSPEAPEQRNPYETPKARPLPEPPLESTTSYTTRELIETRRKLIEHSIKEHAEGLPTYLAEVITHLDRLIERETFDSDRGRRAASDPMPKLDAVSEQLPPISEERRIRSPLNSSFEQLDPGQSQADDSQRVGSGATKHSGSSFGSGDERSTIRIVPQTPVPAPPTDATKPLTIRKKSSAITTSTHSKGNSSHDLLGGYMSSTASHEDNQTTVHSSTTTRRGVSGNHEALFATGLEPIPEDPRSPKRSDTVVSGENKKWSWFKHKSQCSEDMPNSPVKDTQPPRPTSALGLLSEKLGGHSHDDKPDKVVSKRASILKLFGKKKQNRRLSHEVATGGKFPCPVTFGIKPRNFWVRLCKTDRPNTDISIQPGQEQDDTCSIATNTAASEVSTIRQRPTQEQQEQKQEQFNNARSDGSRNWFARFFHVKPARRVIALNTSKVKGRKEVIKILKEWKQYGLEGVHIDKTRNVIVGSVGEVNCKSPFRSMSTSP